MTIYKTLHDRYIQTVFSNDAGGAKVLALSPLTFASYLYRGTMSFRNQCYRRGLFSSVKLLIPVISVGNITVGGTGKTPTTLYLSNLLHKEGIRVAVISRGYKGTAAAPVNVVSDGSNVLLSAHEAGDEPFLMAHRLPGIPILTGTNRAVVGAYAQERFSAQVVLLDDGFQHRRLKRDVDIVLLDQQRPFGNGHLLPRGSLRESPHALHRAHIAVVTQPQGEATTTGQNAERLIRTYHPDIPLFYAHYSPDDLTSLWGNEKVSRDILKGKPVVALAGVGRPGSFVALLERLGAQVVETRFFPDHHHYRQEDLDSDHRNVPIITTEKDAVKLNLLKRNDKNVLVVPITLKLDEEALFISCLKKCLPSLS